MPDMKNIGITQQMLSQITEIKNARAIMELFDDKREWGISEVAETLGLNINTAAKTIKALVKDGYLTKHGMTEGAWYEKNILSVHASMQTTIN